MSVIRVLDRLFWRGLWKISPYRNLHGIRTAVAVDRDAEATCFERVDTALALVASHDPATFARIQRYVSGILVFGTEPHRAAYWKDLPQLCVLTDRYVADSERRAVDLALTLAHEAMHAALCAAGYPYRDGRRAHIEVLCAMAELATARRIPEARLLVGRCEDRITEWATAGEASWSDQSARAADAAHLRSLGVPRWLLTAVGRLRALVIRRAV